MSGKIGDGLIRMGRPLMVTPTAIAASRAAVTGTAKLCAPSPDMSITLRSPSKALAFRDDTPNVRALEIDVSRKVLNGRLSSLAANANALSALSMICQGTTDAVRTEPAHSK